MLPPRLPIPSYKQEYSVVGSSISCRRCCLSTQVPGVFLYSHTHQQLQSPIQLGILSERLVGEMALEIQSAKHANLSVDEHV
jgi:hypothetical protein